MPIAPKRPCAIKSCPQLTSKRFCEWHEREHWERLNKQDTRPSAAARGYDATWTKLARIFRARHPLCEDCQEAGRTAPSEMVHHIEGVDTHPHLRLVWRNLRALCRSCHERRHGYDG